jgi:hypothetical protein
MIAAIIAIVSSQPTALPVISIPDRWEIARLRVDDGPKHITVARIPATVISSFTQRR